MLFAFASVLLSIAYAALLLIYLRGWQALPEWRTPKGWEPSQRVSVIIPARNEAANIGACLRSITEGSYPAGLLEIIVIDDHSDDGTVAVVTQFSESGKLSENSLPEIRLVSLVDFIPPGEAVISFKKKAIEAGIARATGELIVMTDADCVVPKDWLRLLVSRFDPTPEGRGEASPPTPLHEERGVSPPLPSVVGLLAAPVAFHREHNLHQRFQSLDFLGLMGITGAGIQLGWQRMGNGANLAFPKAVFQSVGGFSGNENKASGDDMFLMQKVAARWPGSVYFLKNPDATVLTEAKPDWRSFIEQRLRWGTKNATLPEWPVRVALLTVFLFCWSIWLNVLFQSVLLAVIQLFVKGIADYFFLREMCRFFKREDLLRWFVPSFFLHTLYIPLLGAASLFFKKYQWKGRKVE